MIPWAYLGYRLLRLICLAIPLPIARLMLPGLASIYYHFGRSRRPYVQHNLRILGEHLGKDFQHKIPEVYYHFACFLFEFFSFRISMCDEYVKDDSLRKRAKECFGEPGEQGVLLLVNHQGNWEIALKKLLSLGYPVTTVALRHSSQKIDDLFSELRSHPNLELIYLEDGAAPCLSALNEKRILALACERDYTGHGVEVELAGKQVKVPIGPAYLHKKSKAIVTMAKMIRTNLHQMEITIDSIEIPEKLYSSNNVIQELSQHIMPRVFSQIYDQPEQWITFDNFFGLGKKNT